MGGYERDPRPWSLDGIPPDFNHRLLDPDWPRFEAIMAGAIRRVPAIADAPVTRMINGPEGFTPDNEFILGEIGRPRALRRRGVLRARHRRRGGHRPPGRVVDRRRRAGARPVEDGHPPLRAAVPEPRATRSRGAIENYATYYDIHYPNEERQAGRPSGVSPAYARLAALGASFGEKRGGSGRTGSSPMRAARAWLTPDLEALRPRGWAGEHWSPAIGAEALATRDDRGALRRDAFAKIELVGPGRRRCCSGCVPTTSTARSAASRTPSC